MCICTLHYILILIFSMHLPFFKYNKDFAYLNLNLQYDHFGCIAGDSVHFTVAPHILKISSLFQYLIRANPMLVLLGILGTL